MSVDADLRAALEAAALRNPRQLGKWLRRIEGRVIAGVRLERIGEDSAGIVWRVQTVPGLEVIADLERQIVQAHDEKIDLGASAEELAGERPDVGKLAATVADRLRAEYRARRAQP